MSFKYINPGYVSLTESKNMTQSTLHAALNGVSLQNTTSRYNKFYTFNCGSKFYFKFNFYWAGNTGWGYLFGLYDSTHPAVQLQFEDASSCKLYVGSTAYGSSFAVSGTLMTISGYVDVIGGAIKIYCNGTEVSSYTGSVMGGAATDIVMDCYTNRSGLFFSDLIVSDQNILGEKVAVVPIKSTVLNGWTANSDGTYSTGDTGQQLLQTLDIDTLKSNIGTGKSIVYKSISINGIPAYYDFGSLNKLKTVVTDGTNTANPETQTLTTTTSAGMWTAGIQNPLTSSDWTESALRGISVGVESAESS